MDYIRQQVSLGAGMEAYIQRYMVPRHLAEGYKEGYRARQRTLTEWLQERKGIQIPRCEHLTPALVEEFMEFRATKLAETTWNNHLSQYRTWCKWLVKEQYIPVDPTENIFAFPEPKAPRGGPQVEEEEYQSLLPHLLRLHPRDSTYFVCAAQFGRRVGEMESLTWNDISFAPDGDFQSGTYTYTEHKKHDRRVTQGLSPTTNQALREWKEAYREQAVEDYLLRPDEPLPGEWYVFPAFRQGPNRRRLNPTKRAALTAMVRKFFKEAGIYEIGKVTHGLRRLAASRIEREFGLPYAQTLLGHKNATTTERYLNRGQKIKDLAKAMHQMYATPAPQTPIPTEAPEPVREAEEVSNVISFADRFKRRTSA